MTKTYDDIEAVTRLLEEKEKDLELTARIGKELLQTNSKLENTVASLETDLRAALEKITQLSHEVHKKTELIQILTNDMDESLFETGSSGRINLDLLQKKMANLEEENKALKSEYCRLAKDTETVEEQEQMLLKDLTGQLTCANSSVGYLADELDRQKDENRIQHEQLLTLQAKLEDMEEKLRKFMHENEELNGLLQITKDNQGSLAIELAEFKARYYEVESLLRETQEQLRKMRKKQVPGARISLFSSLGGATATNLSASSGAAASPHNLAPFDSLQSELEMSMHSEFSTDSGISNPDVVPQYKKVFETVRCASQSSLSSAESTGSSSHHHSSAAAYIGGAPSGPGYMTTTTSTSVMSSGSSAGQGPRMSIRAQTSDFRRSSGSVYSSSSLGYPSIDSTGHSDTEFSLTDSDDGGGYPSQNQKGIPGAPGASELEAALKRLTPGEVLARRANLQHGPAYGGYEGETYAPFGCRTPDSLMSTGSGNYMGWKLPEKLQIVKPIEGSQTLHQWSQLAQPTFGGLLDERPGVKIRGGKELEEMGLESYALSDLEEDEEYSNPGKMFDSLIPTYTLTNSTVMHPDDGTFVTSSNVGSRMASVCSSIQNSPPQTPQGTLSRRNSCTTFSTTYGLAKILNERGIKAATPSAFNTPCGTNSFTPTATPCNSPDGGRSASSSRSNSPDRDYRFSIPQLIFGSVMPQFFKDSMGAGGGGGGGGTSTGAKKKTTATPSGGRNSRRDGSLNSGSGSGSRSSSKDESRTSESLVGKIERIGITNLMGSAPGALSISTGGLYARPALTSPMAQLTCLLPSHSNENLTHIGSTGTSTTKSPSSNMKTPAASAQSGMGIPGRPGSGALSKRLEQLNSRKQRRQGVTRPDLGTVSTKKSLPPSTMAEQPPEQQTSTLGTISSLLFGRKGGLF